jgi:hypothetical protein
MSVIGNFKYLGYHPQPCGRSYHRVKCECGRIVDIFAWRGVKKCECGRLLSIRYSPEGRGIQVTDRELGIVEIKPIVVTAPCITCSQEIHYVHGVGWCHEGAEEGKEFDHPALPVPDKIKREES